MLPLQRENVHRLKAFLMLNKQEMHLFGKIQGILHADKGKPLNLWEYLCTVGTVMVAPRVIKRSGTATVMPPPSL
ncbi:MAG: hypothetical protein ACLTE2_13440 [Eubacteriales bacterium]